MGGNFLWGGLLTATLIGILALVWPTGPVAAAEETRYLLRPGDTIVVNVLEDPELDVQQILILPDGRISLPVAGTIEAAGRSPEALAGIIRARIAKNFVQPPSVNVTVTTLAPENDEENVNAEIYVLGEVARPGRYEYDREKPITVLKALSLAGGLGPFAARHRIQIRESVEDTEVLRLFDFSAVEDGTINTARGLAVLSDSTIIVVPERGLFD